MDERQPATEMVPSVPCKWVGPIDPVGINSKPGHISVMSTLVAKGRSSVAHIHSIGDVTDGDVEHNESDNDPI